MPGSRLVSANVPLLLDIVETAGDEPVSVIATPLTGLDESDSMMRPARLLANGETGSTPESARTEIAVRNGSAAQLPSNDCVPRSQT